MISSQKSGLSATGYKVLLVEDDKLLLSALDEGLRLLGHDVKATPSGGDAPRLMELMEPDVVVSDIVMAEMDMLDTFTKLSTMNPDVKIVAISGNRNLLAAASQHGVRHMLAKPFDLKRLDFVIRTAMR